jgi:hypothetical protein
VNVYLKNRRHAFKLLIEVGEARLDDCAKEHWENMKHLVALEAKQGEASQNCAIHKLVTTPSHYGHSGEVGVTQRLVKMSINPTSKLVSSIHIHLCCLNLVVCHWHDNELRCSPTAFE